MKKQAAQSKNNNKSKKLPLRAAIALIVPTFCAQAVFAGPEGGKIVGGQGSISQSGPATIINQSSQRMAIDWNSYNLSTDERVQYVQPNSSSLSLNRILSHQGSQIHGRIDANGQVLLVNPNGIVFGNNAQVNVGGLLATGLNINPDDFMNGRFTFEAIAGKEGVVINSGTLNAATGGSISLLGKRVENNGLIQADLGRISLASGKKAILSFDGGLMGIRVSEAMLQEELGLEPGVLNSGELNAKDGQILLTGAASHDVFTQAMNTGDMQQATGVVVDEDGSFTLSAGGSDVINTGRITSSGERGGKIIALGDNITSSGDIHADASATTSRAGEVELHSIATTEVTEDSLTSAVATSSGQGGTIKLLGTNVGLLDNAEVDASGAQGGGEILIGGDKTGSNSYISNADFIYLGQNTHARVNGIENGDGGKLITFAANTARIYGKLSARGGDLGGDGGFIETSGLKSFHIATSPDVHAVLGNGGEWLIDPYDIRIVSGTTCNNINSCPTPTPPTYTPSGQNAQIGWNLIEDVLDNDSGTTVTISTASTNTQNRQNGDITFDLNNDEDAILVADLGSPALNSTLELIADRNVNFEG